MDQKERDVIMREFRSGSSRVLITTDLLVSDGCIALTLKQTPQKISNFCDSLPVTEQLKLLGDQGSFSTMGFSPCRNLLLQSERH